jgi:ADP-heptose:LPS heptosyltransferase
VKRILIIQTAFLGDVILATPLVAELKRIFPDAELDVLVKSGNQGLLENNPHLRKVFIFDKSKGKFKSIIELIRSFRNRKYDLIINLHRFGSSGLIAVSSGAKEVYGFKKNPFSFLYSKSFEHPFGDGTHEVSRNLKIISDLGAVSVRRPELYPSEHQELKVKPYKTGNYFCMAPASVWFTKQLPEHKWVELIQKRAKEGKVYLLGGPGDYELCKRIIERSGMEDVVNLAGKLDLLESAALMRGAVMNYVNDSGPLHLASAVNGPVTAYFCSTIPEFGFGPLSEISAVVQVDEKLECRPCGMHGFKSCPKGHFKCGNNIVIE